MKKLAYLCVVLSVIALDPSFTFASEACPDLEGAFSKCIVQTYGGLRPFPHNRHQFEFRKSPTGKVEEITWIVSSANAPDHEMKFIPDGVTRPVSPYPDETTTLMTRCHSGRLEFLAENKILKLRNHYMLERQGDTLRIADVDFPGSQGETCQLE